MGLSLKLDDLNWQWSLAKARNKLRFICDDDKLPGMGFNDLLSQQGPTQASEAVARAMQRVRKLWAETRE